MTDKWTNAYRMIAIDLLDEVLAEMTDAHNGIDEWEHDRAQSKALCVIGEHDPKMLVRALIIAIADAMSDAAAGRQHI